jgi:hypothetical protein
MVMATAQELLLEGKAEGEAIGEKRAILTVLGARFGEVPQQIAKSVNSYTDHIALESLTVLAAKCKSLDEFNEGVCR